MAIQHDASKRQEKRITKSLNEIGDVARKQVASGALWNLKSDVVSSLFRVEAKTRVKECKQITIKKDWFDKIEREGFETGKIPALVISFGNNKDYFCIEDTYFLPLVEELISLRRG